MGNVSRVNGAGKEAGRAGTGTGGIGRNDGSVRGGGQAARPEGPLPPAPSPASRREGENCGFVGIRISAAFTG